MKQSSFEKTVSSVTPSPKNWEQNVTDVKLETCPLDEDPLGYRAIFVADEKAAGHGAVKAVFCVGASFLAQRGKSLTKAGFQAPMTLKAIALVENRLGQVLSSDEVVAV